MKERNLYLETFLISFALILLEVSYTRVFSFKLVYYFTYLIIGISLLGLGAGGVFCAIFPSLRRMASGRLIPACCLAASAAVLLGYVAIARIQLNAFQLVLSLVTHDLRTGLAEGAKLAVICGAVFTPFLAAGLALATIFATQTERINRLYFVDLVGAGLGCALCVPLIARVSPPGAIMVAGLAFALAGARLARHSRVLIVSTSALALALLTGAAFPGRLPDPVVDRVKSLAPGPDGPHRILFSQWSPVFRVDVVATPRPTTHFLVHDGTLGSLIERFDGDRSTLARFETTDRAYPFRILDPAPRVAIVGAAGGHEILASLYFNAAHVTAIELNPVTVSVLKTHFADFTGHLAEHPRVELVNAEGRSFLKRQAQDYDLIWFVAPDSYAAMNAATSGAFVLAESYLYTTEMLVESLQRLSADGVICTQFGELRFDEAPNRTVRYVGTARAAFRRLGLDDFARHVLVATTPGFLPGTSSATILLKKSPFTEAQVRGFIESAAKVEGGRVRQAWPLEQGGGPIDQVISLPDAELEAWYRAYPFAVQPVSDDSPFFWHFVRFADVTRGSLDRAILNPEEGLGERLLLLFLCVATAFAAVFLLAPLFVMRATWRAIPYKTAAGIYFAALGVGFMLLEVSLIQRLTLFLGYPTYSLSVTLFALLVSAGAGSLLSERSRAGRNRLLLGLSAGLVLLLLFYTRAMAPILDRGVGWPLAARVALTVALLAPLGLCLGTFMPLGLRTVAALTPHGEEFVAWGWAVNGFFSVVSAVLATLLSMSIGFERVMLSAVVVYLAGIAALMSVPAGVPVSVREATPEFL